MILGGKYLVIYLYKIFIVTVVLILGKLFVIYNTKNEKLYIWLLSFYTLAYGLTGWQKCRTEFVLLSYIYYFLHSAFVKINTFQAYD